MRTAIFAYYQSYTCKHEALHHYDEQGLVLVCSYKVGKCKGLCSRMASAG